MEMYIIIYNKPLFTFSSFSYGRKSKKKKKKERATTQNLICMTQNYTNAQNLSNLLVAIKFSQCTHRFILNKKTEHYLRRQYLSYQDNIWFSYSPHVDFPVFSTCHHYSARRWTKWQARNIGAMCHKFLFVLERHRRNSSLKALA